MATVSKSGPDHYRRLYDALLARAKAKGFRLGPDAADVIVARAIMNIEAQSETDADRRVHIKTAIEALNEVTASVMSATQQRSFANADAVRDLMRAKACGCPWPWGTG